jgi:predicted MFS family arabinose efflux permease
MSAVRSRVPRRGRRVTALRARLPRAGGGSHRGIVALVRSLLLFESAMYSAVTPVLPHYAHTLHAGKTAMGVLVAAYAAGIVPGSLLGAWMATRVGERRTTLAGLLVFTVSIAGFGFASDVGLLDGLRFLQGTGCGLIWGGGLTWVIAIAPRDGRGEMLGSVMAAAIFGTLLGPVLGMLAVAVGTAPVFSVVAAASVALALWTARHPDPDPAGTPSGPAAPLSAMLRSRRLLLGAWLIVLEAGTIGATGTLLPLRLSRFGASSLVIGATFLMASLISSQVSGPIGRVVDRSGAGRPLYVGLTMTAILMALLPLPQSTVLLSVVSVIALGGPLTAYTIPAISLLTDAGERLGIPVAVATMILNLAWAGGEAIGAPAAARLSAATTDAVPLLALSALMVASLVAVIRARLRAPDAAPRERAAAPAGR